MGESLVSVAFDTSRKRRIATDRLWASLIAHHDHHNGRPQMPTTQPEMEKVERTVPEVAKPHLPSSVLLEDASGTVGLEALRRAYRTIAGCSRPVPRQAQD